MPGERKSVLDRYTGEKDPDDQDSSTSQSRDISSAARLIRTLYLVFGFLATAKPKSQEPAKTSNKSASSSQKLNKSGSESSAPNSLSSSNNSTKKPLTASAEVKRSPVVAKKPEGFADMWDDFDAPAPSSSLATKQPNPVNPNKSSTISEKPQESQTKPTAKAMSAAYFDDDFGDLSAPNPLPPMKDIANETAPIPLVTPSTVAAEEKPVEDEALAFTKALAASIVDSEPPQIVTGNSPKKETNFTVFKVEDDLPPQEAKLPETLTNSELPVDEIPMAIDEPISTLPSAPEQYADSVLEESLSISSPLLDQNVEETSPSRTDEVNEAVEKPLIETTVEVDSSHAPAPIEEQHETKTASSSAESMPKEIEIPADTQEVDNSLNEALAEKIAVLAHENEALRSEVKVLNTELRDIATKFKALQKELKVRLFFQQWS